MHNCMLTTVTVTRAGNWRANMCFMRFHILCVFKNNASCLHLLCSLPMYKRTIFYYKMQVFFVLFLLFTVF